MHPSWLSIATLLHHILCDIHKVAHSAQNFLVGHIGQATRVSVRLLREKHALVVAIETQYNGTSMLLNRGFELFLVAVAQDLRDRCQQSKPTENNKRKLQSYLLVHPTPETGRSIIYHVDGLS